MWQPGKFKLTSYGWLLYYLLQFLVPSFVTKISKEKNWKKSTIKKVEDSRAGTNIKNIQLQSTKTPHIVVIHAKFITELCNYSQTRIKCSRPLCSLPGLQGQNFFADAIINFLILFKSIRDKNWYDQLFIHEVVKLFTFQFDESVIKVYLVKVFQILMKFS